MLLFVILLAITPARVVLVRVVLVRVVLVRVVLVRLVPLDSGGFGALSSGLNIQVLG